MTGAKLRHVPYRGAAPAMNDLIAGHVPILFDNLPTVIPQVQAGTVRALADLVASAESVTGTTATVGIGMPGAVSPATGLVKNANSVWLNGRPFDRDLSQLMGRPLRSRG
jgi:predicted NBD/HSP70 family sugar kinase